MVFAGAVVGDELINLYAGSLAVVYAPFDEDYGHVTLEAFLCAKPVITATDPGGTLEFVVDDQNGLVLRPSRRRLAAPWPPWLRIARGRTTARRDSRARQITWDGVVERLLG